MSQPAWERPPIITPNYGRSKLSMSGLVPRSREIDVILHENVEESRQLATIMSALTLENSRSIRLINTSRKKFVARQMAKQRELERGGLFSVSLLPPNVFSPGSSSARAESSSGVRGEDSKIVSRHPTGLRYKRDGEPYGQDRTDNSPAASVKHRNSQYTENERLSEDVFYEPFQHVKPLPSNRSSRFSGGDVTLTSYKDFIFNGGSRLDKQNTFYASSEIRDSERIPFDRDPRFLALMASLSRPSCVVLPNKEGLRMPRPARSLSRRRSTLSHSRKSTGRSGSISNTRMSTGRGGSGMTDRSIEITIVE